MIERLFMACEEESETSAQFGPFKTSAEAEKHARRLGWSWVLVYTHELDDKWQVKGVRKRAYQIDVPGVPRRKSKYQPMPMNPDEERFFGQYEKQMEEYLKA